MARFLIVCVCGVFLTSCAPTNLFNDAVKNPFTVPEGEGAFLSNKTERIGGAEYAYEFSSATTSEGRKQFSAGTPWVSAEPPPTYRIPTGGVRLGLIILYAPDIGFHNALTEALHLKPNVVRYQIRVVNAERKASGLEGIRINAVEGATYSAKCKVENGKAYVWIEDQDGQKVSDTVRGVGGHGDYWLWSDLPDPDPVMH